METKRILLHGQWVTVKVFKPGKAVGASNFTRYRSQNETGATLATAQAVSKARFKERKGCKSPNTTSEQNSRDAVREKK